MHTNSAKALFLSVGHGTNMHLVYSVHQLFPGLCVYSVGQNDDKKHFSMDKQ